MILTDGTVVIPNTLVRAGRFWRSGHRLRVNTADYERLRLLRPLEAGAFLAGLEETPPPAEATTWPPRAAATLLRPNRPV